MNLEFIDTIGLAFLLEGFVWYAIIGKDLKGSAMSATPERTVKETYPVKPGDWVVSKFDLAKVAKVKSVYRLDVEGFTGKCLVDLVLYSRSGEVVGRESPSMGGPKKFEPAMDYCDWERIDDPGFPIELRAVPDAKRLGTSTLMFATRGNRLPDREWVKPERKLRAPRSVEKHPETDFDPELEAAARRMAAQELRDAHRKGSIDLLIKRAEELEREAETICPRV